jgi:hypothetical protein
LVLGGVAVVDDHVVVGAFLVRFNLKLLEGLKSKIRVQKKIAKYDLQGQNICFKGKTNVNDVKEGLKSKK